MTDTLELEIAIKRIGITKRAVAQALKLSEMGLHKKISGITEFKASEISKMQKLLKLSNLQRDAIFFKENVDFKSLKAQ